MPNRSSSSGDPAALPSAYLASPGGFTTIDPEKFLNADGSQSPSGSLRRTQYLAITTDGGVVSVEGIAPAVNGQELLITVDGDQRVDFYNWRANVAYGWKVNVPSSPRSSDATLAVGALRGSARLIYVVKPKADPNDEEEVAEEPFWLLLSFAAVAQGGD